LRRFESNLGLSFGFGAGLLVLEKKDPSTTEQAALKIQTAYKAMKERKERERIGKMNGNNTRVISM